MAKTSAGGKKTQRDLSAGWGVWLGAFAVLFVPSWLWASRNAFDDQKSGIFPWMAAFVIATLGAGLISFLANAVLQSWSRRRRKAAHKKR